MSKIIKSLKERYREPEMLIQIQLRDGEVLKKMWKQVEQRDERGE